MLEVGWLGGSLTGSGADALIAGVFDGAAAPEGLEGEGLLPYAAAAARALAAGLVTGEAGEATVLPVLDAGGPARLVLVRLGERGAYGPAQARLAAARGARAARASGARRPVSVLHRATTPGLDGRAAATAVVVGMRRGLWRYDGYRTRPAHPAQVEALYLYEDDAARAQTLAEAMAEANAVADAVALAREIAVLGSNDKFPARVAERALAYAAQVGMEARVLDETELAEMGAGCILGVGQGSVHPPRMVVLRTGGGGEAGGPVLGLVGKGITFDSGGISLKPAAGMEEMKYDLCGAAAVLAAVGALARLGSPVPVVGILCLAENLPGGSAQRPGDVVRSLDGQTVEVVNTDAEGRLVMADGLALARRLGATHLVDVATLTGACVVALGHAYTGLMANDDSLAEAVAAAAASACERVARLPIDDPMYERAIRSDVADVRNVGGREAGAITAATFLRRFVGGLPWVHLDIAGTAWLSEERWARLAGIDTGPTGVMVETLTRLPGVLAAR
ncbi:MAG: leucyl aminopeptidase [Firmicutes bacterium]|nr:leucyl aminopeptidase [Bacillota bacterium]